MKTKKGNVAVIALIVVIVIITAGVVGWMFAKKQQAPAQQAVVNQPAVLINQSVTQPVASDKFAGWQTYTDTQHGFELRYPAGFVITKEDEKSISLKTIEESKNEIPAPAYAYINYSSGYFNGAPLKGSLVSFAGVTAVESGSKNDSGDYGTSYDIEATKGDLNYFIQFMNKTKSTLTEDDKQIISSFKFIENISQVNKAESWQTYSNTKYGFEMKIPKDWKVKDEEKINSSEAKETINQAAIRFSVQNKGENFDTLVMIITPTKNISKCSNTPLCNPGVDEKEKNGFTFGFLSGAASGGATLEYYAKYMEEKLKDNDAVQGSFKFTK